MEYVYALIIIGGCAFLGSYAALHLSRNTMEAMESEPASFEGICLTPSKGAMYYDIEAHKVMVYDGATWRECSSTLKELKGEEG